MKRPHTRTVLVVSSLLLVHCGRYGFESQEISSPEGLDGGSDAAADDATTTDAYVETCTDGMRRPGGGCYRLETSLATWSAARTTCNAWGGDLSVLDDAAEETWVLTTIVPQADFWLGITDAAVEGTWLTVDGVAAPYLHWDTTTDPDNPDGGTNSNCGRFYLAAGMWRDMSCASTYAFMCERE